MVAGESKILARLNQKEARLATATELLRELADDAKMLTNRTPCECRADEPCHRCVVVAAADAVSRFLEGDDDGE